jgi:hypothetical protein
MLNFILTAFKHEDKYNNFINFDINLIPKDSAETAKVLDFLDKICLKTKNANKKIKKIEPLHKKLRLSYLSSGENEKFFYDNKTAANAVIGGFYMREFPHAKLMINNPDAACSFTFQVIANVIFYGKKPVFSPKFGIGMIVSWKNIEIDRKEKD